MTATDAGDEAMALVIKLTQHPLNSDVLTVLTVKACTGQEAQLGPPTVLSDYPGHL